MISKPPLRSYRRIDQFKQLAYDCNLTDEDARKFGKLSKTATWELLLNSHGLEFDSKPEITHDIVASANDIQVAPINFFEWVDVGQFMALDVASTGLNLLILSLYPHINPLNLFPRLKNYNSNRRKIMQLQ
jgi:hypothetical protein